MNTTKRLELLERMLAAGSEDPFVWYGHAMELRSLGDDVRALQRFDALHARFPDYLPAYLMAAQTATGLGDVAAARDWLEKGIALSERVRDAHTLSELRAALEALPPGT